MAWFMHIKKVAEIDSNEKNHQMPKPSSEIKASISLRDFYLLARKIMIDLCEI